MAHTMVFPHKSNLMILSQNKPRTTRDLSAGAVSLSHGQILKGSENGVLQNEKGESSISRIKEMFGKVELSASSYDTAWVAMVPSRGSSNEACFPQCLDWVLKNQHSNGSWGLNPDNSLLVKDSLSSTLACVLALQKWGVGEQLIQNGLQFIRSKRLVVYDNHQCSPVGFDIVFPSMISNAKEMGLNLPFDSVLMDLMLQNRNLEVQRGNKSNLAYVAEGLGKSYDWNEVMNHQRSNGSLFNSPAATAATLMHLNDDKGFQFLQSLLNVHGMAVPTTYPFEIHARISLVDTLYKLGIDRHFKYEIGNVLSEVYRLWEERNDEVFLDVGCCSKAFRLLRMNGYNVTSDALEIYSDQECFFNTMSLQFKTTNTILELYRAAQIPIFQEEPVLEKIHAWTSTFLKTQLLNQEIRENKLRQEVVYALEFANSCLDRLEHRRSIEVHDVNDFRMLKTSYSYENIDNMELLTFAVQDFNHCQARHHEELQQVKTWMLDKRLANEKFNWHSLRFIHYLGVSSFFPAELAEARLHWSKIVVSLLVFDDMFDIDCSREELSNLIELVERWDDYSSIGFSTERMEIIFNVVYEVINEYSAKALINQGRCIKHHLIDLLLRVLKGMLVELDTWVDGKTSTMDEYLAYGIGAFGVAMMFQNFFLLGPKFSEEAYNSEEFDRLYTLVGSIGRLFNDYHFSEREVEQRKENGCLLILEQSKGAMTQEDARAEVRKIIENHRRELLRMVFVSNGSMVPQAIKEGFWKVSKMCHYMYTRGDEIRDPDMSYRDIKSVIDIPLNLSYILGDK